VKRRSATRHRASAQPLNTGRVPRAWFEAAQEAVQHKRSACTLEACQLRADKHGREVWREQGLSDEDRDLFVPCNNQLFSRCCLTWICLCQPFWVLCQSV
jgi:hypothetical protein